MKKLLFFLVTILLVSCGQNNLALVNERGESFISSAEYEDYMEQTLTKALNRSQNEDSRDLYLKHITIGFSLDVRVGLFGWNKGLANAIEFHMLAAPNEGGINE
jgi:hypothetical protein